MKRVKWELVGLVLLVCLAFASAAFAVRPLIYGMEKAAEVKQEIKEFHNTVEAIQQDAVKKQTPIPYAQLYEAMQFYNMSLFTYKQRDLNSKSAYEVSQFTLTDYGLPDDVFGVISIPKMELEMPLFLGASDANMAAGAAVLAQTSIPLGGKDTNAVIAGHRGYGGYKYFKDIELLEVGDEVTITNLWATLTYKVTEIKIVSPNDVDAILLRPGKDMITLLTCHPYASGGKYRYLVFCERAGL